MLLPDPLLIRMLPGYVHWAAALRADVEPPAGRTIGERVIALEMQHRSEPEYPFEYDLV
jgi:hypothetical protein